MSRGGSSPSARMRRPWEDPPPMRHVRLMLAVLGAFGALCGCASADTSGMTVVRFKVGGLTQVAVVPDAAPAPGARGLVVFLYGRGGRATDQLGNRRFLEALRAVGSRAPVFVFAQSNDHSYWHDRRERSWGRFLW